MPFKGDYGWACELSARKLSVSHPRLHHLEQLVGDNTARLQDLKRLAQHHVHAGSLGNVLAKGTLIRRSQIRGGWPQWQPPQQTPPLRLVSQPLRPACVTAIESRRCFADSTISASSYR